MLSLSLLLLLKGRLIFSGFDFCHSFGLDSHTLFYPSLFHSLEPCASFLSWLPLLFCMRTSHGSEGCCWTGTFTAMFSHFWLWYNEDTVSKPNSSSKWSPLSHPWVHWFWSGKRQRFAYKKAWWTFPISIRPVGSLNTPNAESTPPSTLCLSLGVCSPVQWVREPALVNGVRS